MTKSDAGHTAPKLNLKRTFSVGFAFLLISMFWSVYDNIVAKMLINDFGLNQTWSGVLLALDNIIALFLLPLFGALSDKTRTKMGKRTPYILIGTIVAAVIFVGLAAVDFFQQAVIAKEAISGVLEDSGNFYFTVNGVINTSDAVKSVVATARSTYIFQVITTNYSGYLVAFIGILLIVLIAMASFRTPAVSLMPDVTIKPLRSKANAVINLMGAVGGLIALLATNFLGKDYQNYIPLFALIGGLMLVMLSVFMILVREVPWSKSMEEDSIRYGIEKKETIAKEEADPKYKEKMPKDVKKSFLLILASVILWFMAYNAATSKFSDYATNVVDFSSWALALMIANVAAIISFYPVGIISTKLGRRKTILGGIVILLVAFILGYFVTKETNFLMFVTMALAGIGWATINVNSYPMVVEMSHGSNIGVYTGYYYTASMAAQIATPIFSGILMDLIDRRVLFIYCAVFAALAFVTMLFVRHGDSKQIDDEVVEIDLD
ncbi:MAG: MFS transporter [Bacilli bacterium]|jgi:Na+/melibiose symporter-like transporter|nr:MFS transporter [Bacilli bacterium]